MSDDPPSEGAAALIFDSTGRILLIKENYGAHRWSLPGGAIEPGETPEEAAVRETMEETELRVRIDHLVGRYTLEDGFTGYGFRCVVLEGEPKIPHTGEIADVRWWPPDDVPSHRSNILHYALPDALHGRSDVVRVGLPLVS